MNAEQLRALQAPVKDRYKSDPPSAKVILKAEGQIQAETLTFRVEAGRRVVEAGLHPAAGGDGRSACSAEMLLEALIGCAGVTLSAVATALGITLRGGRIAAEGDMDFRGTLGVSKEVPVGITTIRLRFELDTDADDTQLDTLIRLTERYCVVFQTLKNPPAFEVSRVISGRNATEPPLPS